MSTRCNILVNTGAGLDQYYHHCDGYLSGVGQELFTALQGNFSSILEVSKEYLKEEDVNLHGDIEFLYYVDLPTRTIKYNHIGYTPINGQQIEWQEALELLNGMVRTTKLEDLITSPMFVLLEDIK